MQQKNPNFTDSFELSKMFHEIKNPLALISSSLQFIEGEHPEVKDFRFWNQTMKDVKNLRILIDDLSTFQKSSFLNLNKINLFDFTEDLLESTESYLLENGTPLILECTNYDLDFYGDDLKLRQAVINLLKNAAESSQAGSPIELKITNDEQFLYLKIKDYGCGMDSEQISHIFEPFHTTKSYGTGLGLPIVKKIIESHNGVISINSEKGTGTTFQIRLSLTSTQQTVS